MYSSIEILTNKLNPYFDYITTNYKEGYIFKCKDDV